MPLTPDDFKLTHLNSKSADSIVLSAISEGWQFVSTAADCAIGVLMTRKGKKKKKSSTKRRVCPRNEIDGDYQTVGAEGLKN